MQQFAVEISKREKGRKQLTIAQCNYIAKTALDLYKERGKRYMINNLVYKLMFQSGLNDEQIDSVCKAIKSMFKWPSWTMNQNLKRITKK